MIIVTLCSFFTLTRPILTQKGEHSIRPNDQGKPPDSIREGPARWKRGMLPTPYPVMCSTIADFRRTTLLYTLHYTPLHIGFILSKRTDEPRDNPSPIQTPLRLPSVISSSPSDYTLAETAKIGLLVRFSRLLFVSARLRTFFPC